MSSDEANSRGAVAAADREALDADLGRHRAWLESDGRDGARWEPRGATLTGLSLEAADLRRVDVSDARLERARLVGARLNGACLKGADLRDADLSGATLREVDLRGASLDGTRFRDVDLRDADLTDARGLAGTRLGGADLAGAKLPDPVAKFEGLVNVQESSRNAQNLFTSILLLCAYTWLTIISTRDAQLLNSAAPPSARLPILGTDIPLFQFYLVAPLLLLVLHVYFLLGLQRIWEELGDLPAVFPDGRTLDKKAHPWMLNGLVGLHFRRLQRGLPSLTLWQARMAAVGAWGVVPFTLLLFWARYLRLHDPVMTAAHVAFTGVAVGVGYGLYRLATETLRAGAPSRQGRPRRWMRVMADTRTASLLTGACAAAVLGGLSAAAKNGVNLPLVDREVVNAPGRPSLLDPRVWVPWGLKLLGSPPFAQLDEVDLSVKPAGWTGKEVEVVKGADLGGRDLRYADAFGVFLVNGYLKGADLRYADLRDADLRGADLRRADLRGANLRRARLTKADLTDARLDDAFLFSADLSGANLTRASLKATELEKANLADADLSKADLSGADLRNARLQGATLAGASTRGADLSGAEVTGSAVADPILNLGPRPLRELPRPAVTPPDPAGLPRPR